MKPQNFAPVYLEPTVSALRFSPLEAVNADGSQEICLSRLLQVRFHAESQRVLDILHILRALRNDVVTGGGGKYFSMRSRRRSFDV